MNGFECIQAIRATGSTVPIVITSASALKRDFERVHELGADGYLIKPFTIEQVESLAAQLVFK